jgi:hypothetical protein
MQQNAQASSADGQESVRKEVEEKETVGWSPYRVGSSKRIVGWGTAVHHHQVTLMHPNVGQPMVVLLRPTSTLPQPSRT